MRNVRRFGEMRQVAARGDIAAYFVTGSLAEHHLLALRRLLKQHVTENRGPVALALFCTDHMYRRRVINENLHLIAAYFDARTYAEMGAQTRLACFPPCPNCSARA